MSTKSTHSSSPLPLSSLFQRLKTGRLQFGPFVLSMSLLGSFYYSYEHFLTEHFDEEYQWISKHFLQQNNKLETSSNKMETNNVSSSYSQSFKQQTYQFWINLFNIHNILQTMKSNENNSFPQISSLWPCLLDPSLSLSFYYYFLNQSQISSTGSGRPLLNPTFSSTTTPSSVFLTTPTATSNTTLPAEYARLSASALQSSTTTTGSPLPLPSATSLRPPVPIGIIASAVFSCLASCAAEFVCYPFDFAKTRLQIQSDVVKDGKKIHSTSIVSRFHGMLDVLTRVPRESPQGVVALYSGLRPALLRQATYGTLKVVFYERLKHTLEHTFGVDTPVTRQLISGALAGALSSAICTPTDLVKVRMAGGDRHYTSISNAFRTIIKDEGFLALYKGVIPTTQRAVVVTLLNLPTYDISKDYLLEHQFKDGILTHFLASIFAGLISTYGSNPIDTVKSRIMNQPVDETGKGLLYRNSFHCAVKTVQEEGLTALWKGSIPNICRNVPWLIIFWCSYEALKGAAQNLEKN